MCVMKKIIASFLTLALLFLLNSCGNSEAKKRAVVDTSDYKTETLDDAFQISIPKQMKIATQLNPDASMQFENTIENTYLVVIREDRSDFIEAFGDANALDPAISDIANYRKIQVDYFLKRLILKDETEAEALTINGKKAEQKEFTCVVDSQGSEIFYVMTFLEGADHLYWIISWTLSDLEAEHKDSFYAIANSFQEL